MFSGTHYQASKELLNIVLEFHPPKQFLARHSINQGMRLDQLLCELSEPQAARQLRSFKNSCRSLQCNLVHCPVNSRGLTVRQVSIGLQLQLLWVGFHFGLLQMFHLCKHCSFPDGMIPLVLLQGDVLKVLWTPPEPISGVREEERRGEKPCCASESSYVQLQLMGLLSESCPLLLLFFY